MYILYFFLAFLLALILNIFVYVCVFVYMCILRYQEKPCELCQIYIIYMHVYQNQNNFEQGSVN